MPKRAQTSCWPADEPPPNTLSAGFSVVKLATDKETGQQWACKIMSLPPPGKQARLWPPIIGPRSVLHNQAGSLCAEANQKCTGDPWCRAPAAAAAAAAPSR